MFADRAAVAEADDADAAACTRGAPSGRPRRRRSPRASSVDRASGRARAPCPRRRDSRRAASARRARTRRSCRAPAGARCLRCAGSGRGSRARRERRAACPRPPPDARSSRASSRCPCGDWYSRYSVLSRVSSFAICCASANFGFSALEQHRGGHAADRELARLVEKAAPVEVRRGRTRRRESAGPDRSRWLSCAPCIPSRTQSISVGADGVKARYSRLGVRGSGLGAREKRVAAPRAAKMLQVGLGS